MAVISAVDHALWDISGKAAGLPTYMLLGGSVRDRVEVYLHLGGKSGKEAADHAGRLNENWGVTVFKTSPYRVDMLANRWGMVCATAAIFFRTCVSIRRVIGNLLLMLTQKFSSQFAHYN